MLVKILRWMLVIAASTFCMLYADTDRYKDAISEVIKRSIIDAPKSVTLDSPRSVEAEAPKSETAVDAPKSVAVEAPQSITADAPKSVATEEPKNETAIDTPKSVAAEAPQSITADAPKSIATEEPKADVAGSVSTTQQVGAQQNDTAQAASCEKPCAPPPPPCPPKPCAPAPKPCIPPPPPCPPKPCPPKPCKPCCVPAKLCPMPVCKAPCYDPCCGLMTYTNHNVNPSARCSANNNGFTVTADFLWWVSDENELPYAFVDTDPSAVLAIGFIANIHYQWKPGFRIGIGWDTAYDGWDLYADWTWYRNTSKSSVSVIIPSSGPSRNPSVQPPYIPFEPGTGTKVAVLSNFSSGKWRLNYNMIDLELGRSFYVSCGLAMRPFIGARGGWINRKLTVLLSSAALLTDPLLETTSAKVNYWGVGPRFGLNTDWKVGMGFEFFGNASGALLFGRSNKNNEVQTIQSLVSSNSGVFSNISNKKHNWRVVPTMQMILGLGWGDCFNCRKLYFSARVGWESNFYWNLPGFVNPDGNQATYTFAKNIDLSGLTVNFKLDF